MWYKWLVVCMILVLLLEKLAKHSSILMPGFHYDTKTSTRLRITVGMTQAQAEQKLSFPLCSSFCLCKGKTPRCRHYPKHRPPFCFAVSRRYGTEIIHSAHAYVPMLVLLAFSLPLCLCLCRNEMQAKGRFTRYDFVACDKFMTGLRHELFRVNQTYNSLTTVVYVKKIVVRF